MSASKFIIPSILKHQYEIGDLAKLGEKAGSKLIGLDVADPYIDTPKYIKEAMKRALSKRDSTHYTRIRGLPDFVESVAEFYGSKFNLKVDPMDQVLSTTGSGEGLYIIFSSITAEGDEFIVPNPTFPTYASLIKLHGGVTRYVPLKEDFHLDIRAIEDAVTNRTKAIVLCTPNNPTGAVYSERELSEVLKIANQRNLLVISDENYSQVTYDGKKHVSIASLPGGLDNTIVVNGLSKVFAMTGWRLGYVIARSDFIEHFEKLAYEIRGSVNTAVQYAGAKALESSAQVVKRIVREYDKNRHLVFDLLNEAGFKCHLPEGGFEAFPKIPDSFTDSQKFTEFMVEKTGVLIKPGIYFGPDGKMNFRLVYCRDRKVLRQAIKKMSGAMKKANLPA